MTTDNPAMSIADLARQLKVQLARHTVLADDRGVTIQLNQAEPGERNDVLNSLAQRGYRLTDVIDVTRGAQVLKCGRGDSAVEVLYTTDDLRSLMQPGHVS